MPSAMLVLTTLEMPSAADERSVPEIGRDRRHRRLRGRPESSAMRPPRKFAGSRKPRTTLASVTVAAVPPLP